MSARITAHAALHGMRVRDVIISALDAYIDGTPVAPLDTPAMQVVRQLQKRHAEMGKLLGTLHPSRRSVPPQQKKVFSQSVGEEPGNQSSMGFDPAKYHLGSLGKCGHDWQGTGQTLRDKKNYCWQCGIERKRADRLKKKQAVQPQED
jgi:hypothetical protein